MIDISKTSKAEILVALYNNSKPLGMGMLQFDPTPMEIDEATELLNDETYFDYLKGRIMKVDLSGDDFSPHLYDRDNGEGAAFNAIKHLLR